MSLGLLLAGAVGLFAWPFREDVPDAAVVATAETPQGRVELTAGRLRTYCAAHPDVSPRAAAESLLTFEVLAAEARARGLESSPEARRAAAEAAVPRYLKRGFEAEVTVATVPTELLRKAYDRNIGFYKHPPLRTVDHILVAQPGFKMPTDPDLVTRARALAERIAADLAADPPADAEAFRARAARFQDAAKAEGLVLKAENLPRFAQRGPYVQAFADAAFAVPAVGDVTAPTESQFGLHIIRLDAIVPAADTTFEEARADIAAKILGEHRNMEFRRRTEALMEQSGVVVNPALLGNADDAR